MSSTTKFITILALLSVLIGGGGLVFSDEDEHRRGYEREHEEEHERGEHKNVGWRFVGRDVPPVDNELYKTECGSCHFPYQPGLLPARSWERMLKDEALEDHFGDNAQLDEAPLQQIRLYLIENAADKQYVGRTTGFANTVAPGQAPLRISETRYFTGLHHEIPPRLVKDNPKVASYSRCAACHTRASEGSYNEHEVHIPGFGRWDD